MIFHVDMTNHYHQKKYSILALVSVDMNNRHDDVLKKGIVLTDPVRQELLKKHNPAEIHAVLIYFLIRDLPVVKKVIICNDINPLERVMAYVQHLKPGMFGKLKSLRELREETGLHKFSSAADSFARNINHHFNKRLNLRRRKTYFDDGSVTIIGEANKEKILEKLREVNEFREGNQ